MNFKKEHNQYYAAFVESRVAAYINQEEYSLPDLIKDFSFSPEEIAEMEADALVIAKEIGGEKAVWVGRSTSNEDCDIIVDGRRVEIKYVSMGKGTYLNTSLAYFSDKLGFTPFTDYTHKTICPYLEKFFGNGVYKNFSPVSREESSLFQDRDEYKELQKIDKVMRKEYVENLYNFLISNPDKLKLFMADIVSKNVSNKEMPEEVVIFNHIKKEFMSFTKEDIIKKINSKTIKKTSLGLVLDGFRVQIGWQNGTGLNNPTLRVFLK